MKHKRSIFFRELHGVLVQEIKVYNPGDKPAQLSLEKLGIYQWDDATSKTKVIVILFHSKNILIHQNVLC